MEKKTLYRYFGNCATEEERIQVLEWTKASPENLKEFCRERNIYNAILLSTDNIQRTKYDFRRHYRAQLLRIAAVVILLLSVAFGSFYLTMGDRIVPLYSLTVPAGNSNTLLLADRYESVAQCRFHDKIPLVVLGNATQYRNRRRSLSRSRPQPLETIYRKYA